MRGIALSFAITALLMLFGTFMARADTLYEGDLAGGDGYRLPLLLPSGFRLSGGVALPGNKVTANLLANGTGTITANRVTWSEGGSLADRGSSFKDLAPYGGVGYSKTVGGGIKVSWDAGAMFGALPTRPWVIVPGLPENLALENDYLESHMHMTAVEPVAEVRLSFKF